LLSDLPKRVDARADPEDEATIDPPSWPRIVACDEPRMKSLRFSASHRGALKRTGGNAAQARACSASRRGVARDRQDASTMMRRLTVQAVKRLGRSRVRP
jgi:hypothetical protein